MNYRTKRPNSCTWLFLCIFPHVSSIPAINSVSKLSQTSKEDKELSKKTKNPGVGKLTEADKASTGKVGRGLTSSITCKHRTHSCAACYCPNHSLIPAAVLFLFRSSCPCSGPIWKPSVCFCPASACCCFSLIMGSPFSPTTGWACGPTTLWLTALSRAEWWDWACMAVSAFHRVRRWGWVTAISR